MVASFSPPKLLRALADAEERLSILHGEYIEQLGAVEDLRAQVALMMNGEPSPTLSVQKKDAVADEKSPDAAYSKINLKAIVIRTKHHKHELGDQTMKTLCQFADQHHKPLVLLLIP